MIADVVALTQKEGGEWAPWPLERRFKPSNPELLCCRLVPFGTPDPHHVFSLRDGNGVKIDIRVHALKLSDGSVWDCINGFRDKHGPR